MLFKKKIVHDSVDNDSFRLLDDNSSFAFRESFNTLCTNVMYLPIPDACKKIAITSAIPGEGKTNVAINLAASLAQNTDKRVLLIDLDMRSPRVNILLSNVDSKIERNAAGLSEYLAGIIEKPPIFESKFKNLSVIFSGRPNEYPTGIITSAKMDELFKFAESNFDYVIIDTPPIDVVTDALLISNKINGYIIATRSDFSTINSISNVEKTLQSVNANTFGIVLTAYKPKHTKKYGKYYTRY